ncbi:hypothetical protein [Egbenema bharatensis]|uniref:hypothetical protein n=1 Tax=Egbenema bharatensis TaxID=3463334 RepID=UPI003A88D5B4
MEKRCSPLDVIGFRLKSIRLLGQTWHSPWETHGSFQCSEILIGFLLARRENQAGDRLYSPDL